MSELSQPFIYHGVDVRTHASLPDDWLDQMNQAATMYAKTVVLKPVHVTSRELPGVQSIKTQVVGGLVVKEKLPWLYNAYHGIFCELGSQATGKKLYPARDDRVGVVLNVMNGDTGRYEVHVDTNPVQAMLYGSSGLGGELVVAHNLSAVGVEQVEADASVVRPVAGQLLLFDGRRPHYVRAVNGWDRIAAAMNYYDDMCLESDRPDDLTTYLNGAIIKESSQAQAINGKNDG